MVGMTTWLRVRAPPRVGRVSIRQLEKRVRHAVTCIPSHPLRHFATCVVLRRQQRVASRAKSPARFHDEEIAEVELAFALLQATLVDERLGARERARGREQLDRHVGKTLELLLSLDDLLAMVPDHTPCD